MKSRWAVRVTLLLLTSLVLLSACNAGGGPAIDATRRWLQALADLNFKQVMDLTCANPKVRDEIQIRIDSLVDIQDTLQSLKGQFDFSGLKFEEMSNDGRTAQIRLSGKMALKALGQSQTLNVYEDITVVKENEAWKMCANAANLLKF